MDAYLLALAYAAMPALGNLGGGVLAEVLPVSRRTLSLALHAAAGIVLAVVGLELLPRAFAAGVPIIPIAAFIAGGGFYLAVDIGIDRLNALRGGGSASAWTIWFGVAMDLFSDGVMIGTGALLSPALGFLLALGQVPADIPEGFATIATFRDRGVSRARRIALTAAFAVPILLGTTIGFWLVRGQPEIVQLSLLAFTGGVLTTVVVEEIVPEAHANREARLATVVFVGGFALFAILSAYLG
jgi:ZIP family zinc transporter